MESWVYLWIFWKYLYSQHWVQILLVNLAIGWLTALLWKMFFGIVELDLVWDVETLLQYVALSFCHWIHFLNLGRPNVHLWFESVKKKILVQTFISLYSGIVHSSDWKSVFCILLTCIDVIILLFVESNTNIKPTKPMKFKSKNLCSEIIKNNR